MSEKIKTQSAFQLLLFSTNPSFIRPAVEAGIDGVIIDWENIGKEERQAFADTQINRDSLQDLQRVRACTDITVICRINRYGQTTEQELKQAISCGADEILLPMVRTVEEVQRVLDEVQMQCKVGILIETQCAINIAEQLAQLPLSRIYVGLNDLAIDRKTENIFLALADGTIEHIRKYFDIPFGFGGLTLPDCGFPIPCRLLISEMCRLHCNFSFLRRSFHRDIQNKDIMKEIPRIHDAIKSATRRPLSDFKKDRTDLNRAIKNWPNVYESIEPFNTKRP